MKTAKKHLEEHYMNQCNTGVPSREQRKDLKIFEETVIKNSLAWKRSSHPNP